MSSQGEFSMDEFEKIRRELDKCGPLPPPTGKTVHFVPPGLLEEAREHDGSVQPLEQVEQKALMTGEVGNVSGFSRYTPPEFHQEIVIEDPPIMDVLDQAFGVGTRFGIIYSWGPLIFNPDNVQIPPELIAHEAIHGMRQGMDDAEIHAWWERYIEDRRFRLDEELAAHRAEYLYFMQHGNRKQRKAALKRTADRLAAPLYGKLVSPKKARALLDEA